jgi:hypothetical protein
MLSIQRVFDRTSGAFCLRPGGPFCYIRVNKEEEIAARYAHILARLTLGLLAAALMALVLQSGCGQKDPTQPLTGTIFVSSDTTGAAIFLNGADTQQVTPDTLRDVPVGLHVVRVFLEGYISSPESLVVQVVGGQVAQAFFAMSEAAQAQRIVLLEHFTSVNCGPCPATNDMINGLLGTFGPEKVVGIEYHPWPADPLYDAASSENIARANFYGVSSVPSLFVDGVLNPGPTDSLEMVSAVEDRLAEPSLMTIAVTDTVVGQGWSGTARIIGLDDVVASDVRGFFVVLEKEIHYAVAPGTNGERDFYYVMRKILPTANGGVLNISAGDTLTAWEECDLHPDCNPAQIYSIYFVQDYASKEVLQAGTTLQSAASRIDP